MTASLVVFAESPAPARRHGVPAAGPGLAFSRRPRGFALVVRLHRGDYDFVHCLGGPGRTGTVAGCALRLLGRTADQAIATVQSQLPRWRESPWQLDVVCSG